jgi:kynurenine formamidase
MSGMRDLSHEFGTGLPYPGDPAASVTEHATMPADGYRVAALAGSTHSGTHVDAPSHVLADGATLGAYDPGNFRFDARVVDCTDCGNREAIPADRVPETDADLLVFHTGFAERWGDEAYFDHPYLTAGAAERCAAQGCAVGLDAASPDPTPTEHASGDEPDGYPAHRALLGAGCLLVENLRNLAGLPERVRVTAHPLPVDADGAPARVVAEG